MLGTQVSLPQFAVSGHAPLMVRGVDAVALPVLSDADGPVLGPGADGFARLGLLEAIEFANITGAAGEVLTMPVAGVPDDPDLRLVILVGVGKGSPTDLRRAGAALSRRTRGLGSVASSLHSVSGDDACVRAFVEGMTLASFALRLGSTPPPDPPVTRVVLALCEDDHGVLERAVAIAGAGWHSRTLATMPSNIKNPEWFVEQAKEVAAGAGLKSTVLDEVQLAEGGYGGLVAVGAASSTPPRLLRLEYTPERSIRSRGHVVLVGKGITFDSGGLSIKPAEAMVTMKRDMTGGAVVLAVMAALKQVACPVRVTGLVCLAENAIGGDAMRPGDVITHYNGRTTEVTNTDAEGRLVLADALAYAVDKLKPDALVDVATLTGGIKVALGQQLGGIFASDDGLHDAIARAGDAAGEPFWRMPLASVYEQKLSSDIADADNAPGAAPAITAALFLQHFTGGLPWAHLDIASVGDSPDDRDEWTAGPTGFGPRALLYWLESDVPLAGVGKD